MTYLTFAAIADVHANRWALEAVLEDIERRGVQHVVNLGDSLFGPLDPGGTAQLFRTRAMLSVRGNMDRIILEPAPDADTSATFRFVRDALDAAALDWLQDHRAASVLWNGSVLLCHGTPQSDEDYLVERVRTDGVSIAAPDELDAALPEAPVELVLCGHTHVPRLLGTPGGRLIVNPGSVGLPAYTSDAPYPHAMEAGSPHARYAILSQDDRGWRVEHVALPYDWTAAAGAAAAQGRADWAEWITSGRAAC